MSPATVTACFTPCLLVGTPLSPLPLITNKPPTPFEKISLTRRPFVSFSLSALKDLERRIDCVIEGLPSTHAEMRRHIVQFEQGHLDSQIFREVVDLSGSRAHIAAPMHSNQHIPIMIYSARPYITNNGCTLPNGTKVYDPEQYFNV